MAEERELTNSAYRIMRLLQAAQRHAGGNVADGFAHLFETNAGDRTELYRRLSSASQETIFIGALLGISGNEDVEEEFNTSKSKIIQFLSPNRFDITWADHVKIIEPQDIKTLSICSKLLNRRKSEVQIEGSQRKKVLEDIENLRKEVVNSDLPFDLKAIILENIKRLMNAIWDYDIRGAEGLHEAVLVVGENVKNLLGIEKKKGKRKNEKVWQCLKSIALVTATVANLVTAAGPLIHTLPPIHIDKILVWVAPRELEKQLRNKNDVPELPAPNSSQDCDPAKKI
jgi:hypothetical protein